MPRPRKHLVCLSETHYYHVTSRCVRRAFLCGVDQHSGKSYEHRRSWIEDRVRLLSSIFCIDLCAYAIMSNHYHLVVKLNPGEPDEWSDDDVLGRWTTLFRGPLIVQRYLDGDVLSDVELKTLASTIAVYRKRLASLSWFMKCLNEPIARRANAEDHCTGHFWEARFGSVPLCTDRALLTAMAYVDLNPVRAGIATTPEGSEYTSLRARILGDYRKKTRNACLPRLLERGELRHFNLSIRPLMPFADSAGDRRQALPMRQDEYLSLVDATGRIAAQGKRGRIDPALKPILERLGLSPEQWMQGSTAFRQFHRYGDLRLKQPA